MLDNYFMLIGTDGVYSFTFQHEKRPECPVCGGEAVDLTISQELTVDKLIEMLVERQDMCVFLLTNRSGLISDNTLDKSRSRRWQVLRPTFTSKHHHSWRRLLDLT
jgi:hypothetical protein